MSEAVKVVKRGHVLEVTLDRPKGTVTEQATVSRPPLVGTQESLVGGQI